MKALYIANIATFLVLLGATLFISTTPEAYDVKTLPGADTPLLQGVERTYNINDGLDHAVVRAPTFVDSEESILIKTNGKAYVNCDTELMRGTWVISEGSHSCDGANVVSAKSSSNQSFYLEINKPITSGYKTTKYGWAEGVGYIVTEDGLVIETYDSNYDVGQ